MSEQKEPKSAIQAILDNEIQIGNNKYTIYPLTIQRYALLALIESPLLTGGNLELLDLFPTLYIMTHDVKTLSKYTTKNKQALIEDAASESENWSITDAQAIIDSLIKTLSFTLKIAASDTGDKKKEEAQTE